MLIHKLKLNNLGPYYGSHEIELEVTPSAPIILIHGENMRGKTCLQNAIRWCLYGEVQGRMGGPKPTNRLISYSALDAGEYFMTVELDFSHNGHQYQLERHVQSDIRPTSDDYLVEKSSLRRDGHFLPEADISEEIGTILHKDVSRFFLFDTEMLAQYEVLVTETGRQTDIIKQSIEQILGLPAIKQAERDLDYLQREAERRQTQAVRQATKHQKLVTEAEQLRTEIESIGEDLARLNSLLISLETERSELAERRDRFSEIQADIAQVEEIEARLAENEELSKLLQQDIKNLLSDAWWEPVSVIAQKLAWELDNRIQSARKDEIEVERLKQTIDQVSNATESSECPVCKQQVSAEHRDKLEEHLNELRGKLTSNEKDISDVEKERQRLNNLRQFTIGAVNLAVIKEKEQSLRRLNLDARRDRMNRDNILERLRGHDRTEIRALQQKYDDVVIQIQPIKQSISNQEKLFSEKKAALSRVQQDIARLPEADRKITVETEIYRILVSAFANSVDDFRNALRLQVQEEAIDIFKQLTTEPAYSGLVINDQFGLDIVDDKGRVVSERSAGAEQVVAFTLIAALNRAAVREGPIVMDTPFTRLDVEHRAKTLTFIPSMASQIVILVHSREFDIERDITYFEGKIGHQYKLIRDGAPDRTRIERMS